MTATASASAPASRTLGTTLGPASVTIATRTLRKFVRTPQLLVVSTIQGAMFLLIFRYVFGGAIASGGVPYVDFLVPGYVTTSVLFVGMATAAGVAEDLEQGFLDRLRSLPIPRAAVLAGRVLADSGMLAWNLAVTAAVGFAIGFRLHGSLLEGLGAFALCLAFGLAFTWLFVAIGLVAGSAQAAQGMSLMVFPLTFVSSAYVPADSMPGWLQVVADHQPVTAMVDAVRGLCLGDATAGQLTAALTWSVALIVVFAPLAVARFRRS
ncbi:MAG TPA: ABC transporter permease [Acidimicrobiales bacterium]